MGGCNTRGRLSSLAMSISASKYSFWILVSEKDPTLAAVTFFLFKTATFINLSWLPMQTFAST